MGIADVCPTRKTSRGRPPTITSSGSEEQKEKRFKPVKQPDGHLRRIMLGEALRVVYSDYEKSCFHI